MAGATQETQEAIDVQGTTATRVARVLGRLLTHPREGLRWAGDQLRSQRPLQSGLPWVSFPAVNYLSRYLRPGMRVFEWGGGGSTLFLLKHGCAVTTVEHDPKWQQLVAEAAARGAAEGPSGTLDLRFIPASESNPEATAEYIASVGDGAPWDVIMVDGAENSWLSRVQCLERVRALGPQVCRLLVLDDAWYPQYAGVPELFCDWQRLKLVGLGPSRRGVTQTDIYIPPSARRALPETVPGV